MLNPAVGVFYFVCFVVEGVFAEEFMLVAARL
jgi:hypothetical protein